jgi:hypothetical protein
MPLDSASSIRSALQVPKSILRPNVTGVKCVQVLVNAFSGKWGAGYSFNAMQELRSPPAGVEVLERC